MEDLVEEGLERIRTDPLLDEWDVLYGDSVSDGVSDRSWKK